MRSTIAALTLAAVLLHPVLALAQDVGVDEVTLKNGGSVRGTVISSEPGASVKILEMGSKEPRTIPWAQVADVQKGKYAQAGTPPVQPGSAGAGYSQQPQPQDQQPAEPVRNVEAQPALGQDGVVRVHIVSPEPTTLLEHDIRTGAVGGYGFVIDRADPVCTSPCNKVIDGSGGRMFNVGGEFPQSRLFTFSGMTGDVEVGVRPGSRGQLVGGYLAILFGGLGLAGGITMIAIGTVIANDASNPDPGTELLIPGWIAAGVGVAAIAGGIILMVTGVTKVDVHPARHHEARKPNYLLGEW